MTKNKSVEIYDTTLRDGAQMLGIEFTVADKISIIRMLDKLGIQFVEAGFPASNSDDAELFSQLSQMQLVNAVITAFGMTCHAGKKPEADKYLSKLLASGAEIITLVGKSSRFQIARVLKTEVAENLRMIRESCEFFTKQGKDVLFDAEHFFDGYKEDPDCALDCLRAARDAGVGRIILCDTNGGCLPSEIGRIISHVKKEIDVVLGIHAHNDCGMAVANSVAAVEHGVCQVQGTFNGYGERCGNADLCAVIPVLELKLNTKCLPLDKLSMLSEAARFISETCNLPMNPQRPFVGDYAFAHKGGMHADGHAKDPRAYQHANPESVGNHSRVIVSDLSGKANVKLKADEFGMELDSPEVEGILQLVEQAKTKGIVFDKADASLELLMTRQKQGYLRPFEILYRKVQSEEKRGKKPKDEAIVCLRVNGGGKGRGNYQISIGNDGPVDTLNKAIRKALMPKFAKAVKGIRLKDYKVRTINGGNGTRASVRVLIDFSDGKSNWTTVGVSRDILGASCDAFSDAYEYAILKAR